MGLGFLRTGIFKDWDHKVGIAFYSLVYTCHIILFNFVAKKISNCHTKVSRVL